MSDRKEVFIDHAAVDAVDRKIQQSQNLTRGIMSSWSNPMEGLESGPQGPVSKPKPRQAVPQLSSVNVPRETLAPSSAGGVIKIPAQAMKCFKRVLAMCESIDVKLTPDQAHMLLDAVSGMPAPKNMADARAIIGLIEALEKNK